MVSKSTKIRENLTLYSHYYFYLYNYRLTQTLFNQNIINLSTGWVAHKSSDFKSAVIFSLRYLIEIIQKR